MIIDTDTELRLGDYRTALADVECDSTIVDAPYSARTHGGHNGPTDRPHDRRYGRRKHTKPIAFAAWDEDDVRACVEHWSQRTRGWIVSLTDHVLAPVWCAALDDAGRYVFPPLPLVEIGSRVRMSGDGPSSWTCWIVVARPRNRAFQRWGTLRGAYIATGKGDRVIVGGKRLDIMRALVRDYSRPGDLVCDPCAGGGTTLRAAQREGRRSIGAEIDPTTHAAAVERLRAPYTRPLLQDAVRPEQGEIPCT